jgi:uncharacterized membrane protein YqgA involved in biofilm formation
MTGIGTIVNVIAILIGGVIGLFIKKGLAPRFEEILMKALGLSTLFIGVSGALTGLLTIENGVLSTKGTMLMIFSLVIGSFIGELIRIEDRLEALGERLKKLVRGSEGSFVEAFVTNTVVVCVGAMAIMGSIQDALLGDPSTLYAKSILDGVICIVFTSTLGVGAVFAIIPMGLYQGGITLLAKFIEPYLVGNMVPDMSYIGSVLIAAIGVNLAFGKKFKVGNMLPAILVPIVYNLF